MGEAELIWDIGVVVRSSESGDPYKTFLTLNESNIRDGEFVIEAAARILRESNTEGTSEKILDVVSMNVRKS